MKFHIFLFIIALSVLLDCSQAYSNQLRCEAVFQTPIKQRKFQGVYQANACPDNAYNLFKKLKMDHPNEDFSQAKILYIYSRWSGSYRYDQRTIRFRPFPSNKYYNKEWYFHVVVLHDNLIFDLDYGSENVAIPVREYFSQMFGARWIVHNNKLEYVETLQQTYKDLYDEDTPEEGSRLRMYVRPIPAEIYEKEYSFDRSTKFNSGIKNYIYWLYEGSRFPDQTLEEFLK